MDRRILTITKTNLNEMPILPAAHPQRNHPKTLIYINCTWNQHIRHRSSSSNDDTCHDTHAFHCIQETSMSTVLEGTWT